MMLVSMTKNCANGCDCIPVCLCVCTTCSSLYSTAPVVAVGGWVSVIVSAKTSWGLRAKTVVLEYRDRLAQGHNSNICLKVVSFLFDKK